MAGKFSLKMPDFHVPFRDLLHAVNLRQGTHSFTSLPKEEGMLRIFSPWKIRRLRPANLDSKSQHATPRPPKMLMIWTLNSDDILKKHRTNGSVRLSLATYSLKSPISLTYRYFTHVSPRKSPCINSNRARPLHSISLELIIEQSSYHSIPCSLCKKSSVVNKS
jgi:hypothetical protein